MTTYLIEQTTSGHAFGFYEGGTEEEAIRAMHADAGDASTEADPGLRAYGVDSLDDLHKLLRECGSLPDRVMETLPTFGGEEPESTSGVWSWDEKRLLVGTCASDLQIVPRASSYLGIKITTENVTLRDVRKLRATAIENGDAALKALCERAELALYDADRDDPTPRDANAIDLEEVVDLLNE